MDIRDFDRLLNEIETRHEDLIKTGIAKPVTKEIFYRDARYSEDADTIVLELEGNCYCMLTQLSISEQERVRYKSAFERAFDLISASVSALLPSVFLLSIALLLLDYEIRYLYLRPWNQAAIETGYFLLGLSIPIAITRLWRVRKIFKIVRLWTR